MKIFSVLLVTACLGAAAAEASADTLRETYIAKLSSRDHFNSSGERLTEAALIIRQDRANYHKFGVRDPQDESDKFFADAGNREILERLLSRGKSTPQALNAVINGTPTVVVKVYKTDAGEDYVTVTIVE